MKRMAWILAASWLLAVPTARAGELDSEFGTKSKETAAQAVAENPSSELDPESPDQACRHRRWRRGYYGSGFGYGRGYYGSGFGYGRGYGHGRWRW